VRTPWQTLRDGGVPLVAAVSGAATTIDELAAATVAAVADAPAGREAEALDAWWFAWHHHWPDDFRRAFGDGDRLLAWAAAQLQDTDRYLKLRRIAIANLAYVL
jgi:hypothetical protein